MATGFINKLPGGIKVEHLPADKDWGDVDLDSPPKGCGHTTEVAGLPSYGPGQTDSPTFTIGEDTVWQHRGLGKSCGTLQNLAGGIPQTNRFIRIQFELIGFSSREKWLPKSSFQVEALGAIKELARDKLDVPPDHVWPDKQEDGTIADVDYHRRHSKFPDVPVGTGTSRSRKTNTGTGDRSCGTTSRQGRRWLMRWHLSSASRTTRGSGEAVKSLPFSRREARCVTGPLCRTPRATSIPRTSCAALCSTRCSKIACL